MQPCGAGGGRRNSDLRLFTGFNGPVKPISIQLTRSPKPDFPPHGAHRDVRLLNDRLGAKRLLGTSCTPLGTVVSSRGVVVVPGRAGAPLEPG